MPRNNRTFSLIALWSLLLLGGVVVSGNVAAQQQDNKKSPLEGMRFTGQWFLAYEVDKGGDDNLNEFQLKRGYVSVRKVFTDHLKARITQDISVDQEGDGRGDIELRLKYGYLQYQMPSLSFIHKPTIESGLAHRPWLDFEQKMTGYRVQGTMFLERYDVLKSADYGIMLSALIGGEIDEDYQRQVNSAYPGRYGSIALGVYNGGGYSAIEENENKLLEGRLTLRPLPAILPGLQLSCLGGLGKGNTIDSPDLNYVAVFLSMEHPRFLATAQYYTGEGDVEGTAVNAQGEALDRDGFSLFGEFVSPFEQLSAFGRFDHFNTNTNRDDTDLRRYIVGLSIPIHKKSKIIVDHDYLESDISDTIDRRWELAVEINY